MRPLGFFCAALSLLALSACRPAHAQTPCTTGPCTVDVTQAPYNADKTGATDATAAINKAVTDTVAYGNANHVAVTVYLPAGTYFLQNDVIRLQYCQNALTFTGHSASDTFLTYTNNQNNAIFDIAFNTNAAKTATVTIQNFTEDVKSASEFGFTQGTITAIDRTAKPYPTVTVKAEAGYPLLNRPDILAVTGSSKFGYVEGYVDTLYTFSDPKTSLYDGNYGRLVDGNYELDRSRMETITPSADGTTAVIAVNHISSHSYVGVPWMILSNGEATDSSRRRIATWIDYNDNLTLQNINYYGGNVIVDDAGGGHMTGSLTYINYYQGAPPAVSQPGRPARPGIPSDRRQTCFEGFQIENRFTTSFINCDISGGSDDPLNIGGNSARVISQIDSTHIRINGNDGYQSGDTIEIATPDANIVYAKKIKMTNIADQGNGSFLVTLDQAVTIQHFDTGDGKSGDFFTDLTAAGPIVLQNSSFSALEGHLFLKSGVSLLMDHCFVHDIPYSGLAVTGSTTFHQGPFTAHNVTIQNSTFKNCQTQGIYSASGTAPNGENVKILNNTFQDTTSWPFGDINNNYGTGIALEVDGVNGLTISGNTFERNWGANISCRYDANVVISNNTFNHPNFIRPFSTAYYSTDYGDPSSVVWLSDDAGVSLSGNIVSGAGPYTKFLVEVKTNVTNATGLTSGIVQVDNPLSFYLAYDGLVMDQPSSGSILDQAAWTGGKNQQWLTLPAPSTPGFATLTDTSNGKYVGNGTSTAPSASIVLETQAWTGGVPVAEQLWNFDVIDAATTNLLNDYSSGNSTGNYSPGNPSVINVLSGSSAAGTKLGQWYPGNGQNQNFTVLSPPAPLVQAGLESVSLTWASVPNATGYTVSRATSSGGTYTALGTTTAAAYTDAAATPGTTYYYKVAAAGLPLGLTSAAQAAKPLTTQTNVPVNLSQVFNVTGIEPDNWFFLGSGFDGYNFAYSSALVPATLSWSGNLFTLGQPARPDCISDAGQRIVLPTGNFSSLLLLGSYLGDTGTFTPTLTYTDGSSVQFSQGMTNWCGAASQSGEVGRGDVFVSQQRKRGKWGASELSQLHSWVFVCPG